jgi:predicted nucleic acid-binding Zn ribbon protein
LQREYTQRVSKFGFWQSWRFRFAIAEADHVQHMVDGDGCKDEDASATRNQILKHVGYTHKKTGAYTRGLKKAWKMCTSLEKKMKIKYFF